MPTIQDKEKVKIVRWPLETAKREGCRKLGALRILLVENGPPPLLADLREDWVRAPVSHQDLMARVRALQARAAAYRAPVLDPDGVLRVGSTSVVLAPSEVPIVAELVRNYGSLVARESLAHLLACARTTTRNALDLQMMRIRRRIAPLGLGISTAWGRGYLLQELTSDTAREHPQTPEGVSVVR